MSSTADLDTRPAARARIVRIRLRSELDPVLAARWLRGEPRAVALSGAWAGGGVLLSSHPARVAVAGEDPFAVLDSSPLEPDSESAPKGLDPRDVIVGGGWIGWLGYGLARTLETLPPSPPRPRPLPLFDLAFHDHVVRCDREGAWWFEALWTDARSAPLNEQLASWRERLRESPPDPLGYAAGPLRAAGPGTAGHHAAVARAVEYIRAGEMSQANICLRLEGEFAGDPLDLWVHATAALRPAYAAYVAGGEHAVVSLSPELFLRRAGRSVESRPIKGTAPRASDPAALQRSGKDRAENVMIVDLMRNDLGRVSEYGSVLADELCELEPAAGVWHLVSTVRGRLRADAGDRELLAATFPPGSVTGAPKVQAMRVIGELEPTARELYCGAIGLRSPLSGLELSVAIRTFEIARDRIWLGAGGGIVSDSDPAAEVREALAKARGVADAGGIAIDSPPRRPVPELPPLVREPRPDPALGVIETLAVREGRPIWLARHLARLRGSCEQLGIALPPDVEHSIVALAGTIRDGAARVTVDCAGADVGERPTPPDAASALEPIVLPGGLGAHKWADRALIDALTSPGSTPLFCDLDGSVLEAGYAAVMILSGDALVAPPLDGRVLDSISRRQWLAVAQTLGLRTIVRPFTLAQARGADALILTSSLRPPHPGLLEGGPSAQTSQELCDALARAGPLSGGR